METEASHMSGGKRLQKKTRRLWLDPTACAIGAAVILLTIICIAVGCEQRTSQEAHTDTVYAATNTPQQSTRPNDGTPTEGSVAAENSGEWEPDEAEVTLIAKTIYGEASVVRSKEKQAAVAWCILNRVDASSFPDTIEAVVTAPHQFVGYREDNPVTDELRELAVDVLTRWHRERQGETEVGRTLPQGWCFFTGDGRENYFTKEWRRDAPVWDWSLPNPYDN